MPATLTLAIFFFFGLFGAILLGSFLRKLLPDHHLTADSRDTIKMAIGMVMTMTALLLGLLIASAKGSYDAQRNQVIQLSAKVAYFDRVLVAFGPDASSIRRDYRQIIDHAVHQIWSGNLDVPTTQHLPAEAVYAELERLPAPDDAHRGLKAQALSTFTDIAQLRFIMQAQSAPSISTPMLTCVILWLVVVFLSFGLLAPLNITNAVASGVSAFCVAIALLLILELDRPYTGLLQLSREPLTTALSAPL